MRIKHLSFLRALHAHGVPKEQMPVMQALCGELLVVFAFDLPDEFVMATPDLLAQAGLPADSPTGDLLALAQDKLKGQFSAQLLKTKYEGVMSERADKQMEAVLLVFDGFWDQHVRSLVQGDILAVAVRRDVLLVADSAIPSALASLNQEALWMERAAQDAHGLSNQVMRRVDVAWQLLGT
ncbi:MAG: DUF1444 domain-containing protein [Burkholderiales bacterium]